MDHIRNFSIIAHIDHGKSTLADRMLEITHTIEKRKMQDQVLDSMELERERGITIKMQPVRMEYGYDGKKYILNLIDTPGHIDFSYEVSRALKAVEGCVLLVDSTQGVQAQTLSVLGMAREAGLKIIPVLSKIDSPLARIDDVRLQVVKLLDCHVEDVLLVSGRTGEGVEALLQKVIEVIPAPKLEIETPTASLSDKDARLTDSMNQFRPNFRALIFDFKYSTHRGVIVFVRVMNGTISRNTPLIFKIANEKFTAIEVGIFAPGEKPVDSLSAGETGYIVTGIKEPGIASVGDTVATISDTLPPLPGYMSPSPVVWASIYPESQDDFILLKQSLGKLKLSDSSYTFDEESSGSLGRGFRCGFLGMLHLEIITERLKREFGLTLVVTMPTITYKVTLRNGVEQMVYSPAFFPDDGTYTKVIEPWVDMTIICPTPYLGNIMTLLYEHEGELGESENFGEERARLSVQMPLREMMRNFFDKLKSATSGYASVSYELNREREAHVTRLDILVADEVMPAFSRVVAKRTVEEEAEKSVEKLHAIMPRQMVAMKIQGKALGRIISSRTMTAFRKDVTQHMYGGDITRKMKLREKQKKGKKKMAERAKINIPHDVFLRMMRND